MSKLKYILISIVFIIVSGCSQKKTNGPQLILQIGERKIPLIRKENVPEFRKEILAHIKTAWENRKGNESEWITVYSIYGEKLKIKEQPQEITSTHTVSTDIFRIIKKSDNLFITVRKDDPDKAVSSSNSGNWTILEVLLNGFLNDSILQNILNNRHVLQFQ